MNLSDCVGEACLCLDRGHRIREVTRRCQGAEAIAGALGLSAAGDECTERGGGEGAAALASIAVLGAGVDASEGDRAGGSVSPNEDLRMVRVRCGGNRRVTRVCAWVGMGGE